jgi:hypothetical protein
VGPVGGCRQPAPPAGDQAEQDGERLVVAEHQGWQPVAGAQPVAAVAAAHRFDRDVEVDQVVHVPAHRALVDLEPVGEVGLGAGAARLQQLQQGQHSRCRSGHAEKVTADSGRKVSTIRPSLAA